MASTEPTAPLPRPSPDVVYREVGGEVVLVNLQTNRIFALNETGARFWQLLVESSDRGAVEERLAEEFEVEPAALSAEVDALVRKLLAERLVRA